MKRERSFKRTPVIRPSDDGDAGRIAGAEKDNEQIKAAMRKQFGGGQSATTASTVQPEGQAPVVAEPPMPAEQIGLKKEKDGVGPARSNKVASEPVSAKAIAAGRKQQSISVPFDEATANALQDIANEAGEPLDAVEKLFAIRARADVMSKLKDAKLSALADDARRLAELGSRRGVKRTYIKIGLSADEQTAIRSVINDPLQRFSLGQLFGGLVAAQLARNLKAGKKK